MLVVVLFGEEVAAVVVVTLRPLYLRGLGFPECHHYLQCSGEVLALSHVWSIGEGVSVIATELLVAVVSTCRASLRVKMSSRISTIGVSLLIIHVLCSLRDCIMLLPTESSPCRLTKSETRSPFVIAMR